MCIYSLVDLKYFVIIFGKYREYMEIKLKFFDDLCGFNIIRKVNKVLSYS